MSRAPAAICPPADPADCKNATEPRLKPGRPKGPLLRSTAVETGRVSPSAPLAPFVEHYWWVRWDLREPETNEVLSYPSVHVTFEGGRGQIIGVVRAKFSRRLEGRGDLFAIKFRPGMFAPWYGGPIVGLTDRTVSLALELGSPPDELLGAVFAHADPIDRAKSLEARLMRALPELDPDAVLARDAVERVRAEPDLQTVAAVASAVAVAPRALQRLFRDYVGVGPKWVVRRFRLQEAAELLETTDATVASVAASLGYFDQAHFVRDFKAVVGATPSEYLRKARARTRA